MSRAAAIALWYLGIVYAVYLVVVLVMATEDVIGASFTPIFAYFAALPGSVVLFAFPDAGPVVGVLGLLAIPALQAVAIYQIARRLTRRESP